MASTSVRGHVPSVQVRLLFAAALATLAACSDGGGDGSGAPPPPPPPPPATTLTGVVASGAAVPNATVIVSDASATTANVTATAGSDGGYSADVTGLVAPLLVTAQGTLNGEAVSMVAVVPAVTALASNTANVTPLTDAVATLIAPGGDAAALNDPTALASAATAANVSNASQLVVNTLRTDPAIDSALGSGFDPLTTAFAANGSGVDAVLDSLEVVSSSSGVTITNLAAPLDGSGSQSVALTPAQVATPTAVPTLPASSAASTLPTGAQMLALATKLQTCLAEPLATRVTLDANGRATALSTACNFAPAGWRSGGLSWVARLGSFTFSRDNLSNSTVGTPVLAAVLPPANRTGIEFQHPYCNTDTCVVMRVPLTSASGRPFNMDFMLGKVAGEWNYVGNQLPYAMGVQQRMNRKLQVNTALAQANPTNYFANDRIESVARLVLDPSLSDTGHIRAVRWTGPGLPAAGVTMIRSQRCMTADRFVILNQQGRLELPGQPGTQQWWTQATAAADFVLSAARPDGSAATMPTPSGDWLASANFFNQDFSPVQVTASIPAWSEYVAEIFHYGSGNDTPNEVIRVRTDSPYEHASVGAGVSWPTLAPSAIDAYLMPGGPSSGRITAFDQALSFTNPSNSYVSSGWIFSQNRIQATNEENETANYWLRGLIAMRPTALGDTAVQGREWANPANSASLSPNTQSGSTNPNPRCGSAELVALEGDATNLSYREIGLSFRGSGFKLYQDIRFWSN